MSEKKMKEDVEAKAKEKLLSEQNLLTSKETRSSESRDLDLGKISPQVFMKLQFTAPRPEPQESLSPRALRPNLSKKLPHQTQGSP